jgi:hypothetical protein
MGEQCPPYIWHRLEACATKSFYYWPLTPNP